LRRIEAARRLETALQASAETLAAISAIEGDGPR
jgi:hypothetical protein